MSTVQRESDTSNADWKISNKALESLQCFMDGLDDVIIRFAFENAKKRTKDGVVRIESDDIESAASLVMTQMRSQSAQYGISGSEIDAMEECLKCKKSHVK